MQAADLADILKLNFRPHRKRPKLTDKNQKIC
jgi:hypothetical protein